jgi:hypothetical protein
VISHASLRSGCQRRQAGARNRAHNHGGVCRH